MKWKTEKLSELAELSLGKMLDQRKNRGTLLPYLANINVRWGTIHLNDLREMRFESHELKKYGLLDGDIVMCEGGEPGRCAIWKDETPSIMIQKALHRIRPGSLLDNVFLFYTFLHFGLTNAFEPFFTGATIKHLPQIQLARIEVKFPPLPTQRKIASILSAYDDLIENNLKRIKLLEEAAQNIYREWFVHFRFPGHEKVKVNAETGLPEGWRKVNLYDFTKVQMGFALKASAFNSDGIGTPAVRIRDIPNQSTKTYTTEAFDEKYRVQAGDLLIGMDGFFYLDIWAGRESVLVQRVCRLRANNPALQGYLLEAIRGPIKYFEQTISGATVAHLGAKHLKTVEIIIPTQKMIDELHTFKTYIGLKLNLLKQNQKLKEARDILLPRLMNQTIEV